MLERPWYLAGPGPGGEAHGWGTRGSPPAESRGGGKKENKAQSRLGLGVEGDPRCTHPTARRSELGPGAASPLVPSLPQAEQGAQRRLGRGQDGASSAWGQGRGRGSWGRGSGRKWGGGQGRAEEGEPHGGGAMESSMGLLLGRSLQKGALCTPTRTHEWAPSDPHPLKPDDRGSPDPAFPPLPGADRGHGNG